ncbi:hypothetical protein [Planctomycetes bacterium Pla163]
MLVKASLLGAAAASVLFAPTLAESLTRNAAEGETRVRTIEASREMSLVDMVIRFDGEEIPADQLGDIEGSQTDSYSVVVSDTFSSVADGRATKLTRTYTTLGGESAMEGGMLAAMGAEDSSKELSSELEGEDVIFTWDGEEEDYVASLPEESTLDEDLLEDLLGDYEFAELLPDGDIEVGAEWDIDPAFFEFMVEPGGEMHLKPSDADANEYDEMAEQIEEAGVEPTYEGTLKGKLVSVEEGVAKIEITIEIEMTLDLSGELEPMTQDTPMGELEINPVEVVVERTAEGTGTLMWHVAKGRLISFTMEADVTEVNTSNVEIDFGGETMEQFQELTQEGSIEVSYTIE